jgi:dihydroorotate dehydrogenase (NAD+) catalytic subunit
VKPIALAQLSAVVSRVAIPTIGMGGVASGQDARDFLAMGARAVAVGTESFRDPMAGRRIAAELGVISRNERGFLPVASA